MSELDLITPIQWFQILSNNSYPLTNPTPIYSYLICFHDISESGLWFCHFLMMSYSNCWVVKFPFLGIFPPQLQVGIDSNCVLQFVNLKSSLSKMWETTEIQKRKTVFAYAKFTVLERIWALDFNSSGLGSCLYHLNLVWLQNSHLILFAYL